jgi:hypothetical protein
MIASQPGRVFALIMAVVASGLVPDCTMAAVAGDSASSASRIAANVNQETSYSDLVDLIEPAPLVIAVQVHKVAQVEPARAPDVRKGRARIYVEARGLVALRGGMPPGPAISYLADVPLDAKGKLPSFNKQNMLLVARPVAGHPEMVQLVAPDAQLPWDAALETRVRGVLAALQAADAPGVVTGVREAIYVPGNLEGEGETQIFLATANKVPAAISVVHQPGQATSWSASFSEVVDASGKPPPRDTLAWYRLACSLPRELPVSSNVSATAQDQAQAVEDYRLVMAGLGSCRRTRR